MNLNSDIEKGVFDRFRSLPISRAAPLVGAVLGDVVRYVLLCAITLGFGYVLGFRAGTSVPEVLAACAAGHRLRALPVLDLGLRRHDRPHAGRRAGDPDAAAVPADVRGQHVRPGQHAPGLAGGRHQGQPAHAPRRAPCAG